MDAPVCFSQHFVNKQNVRSFTNLFTLKLLKSNSETFLQNVFEEENLVSEISVSMRLILDTFKANLQEKCKTDFKQYFNNIEQKDVLEPVCKENIYNSCWNALYGIIPKSFFGGNQNLKLFRKLLHGIIHSMKRQHILLSKYLNKWNYNTFPWLTIPENVTREVLYKILLWIIKNVISPMISLNFYVTTCKLDADEYKLYFFPKNKWQSFYDQKLSQMVFTKVIKKFDPYCMGKKAKRKHNPTERFKLKNLKKNIPKLHLVLKPGGGYRPIVQYKKDHQTKADIYKMKERFNFLKTLSGKAHKRVDAQYAELHQQWIIQEKPKLYFVKTDLSNAFGSINKEKLLNILCERHTNYQKTEPNSYLKKKFALIYKEIASELRKPLLIRAGSTVYEWRDGLVQGYNLSPALSELYYSHMDELFFSELLKNSPNINLFTRVVDDYLYITDSLENAEKFLEVLSNYRNVNYGKTVVNFINEKFKYSEQITFLGYSYDTNTLHVSRANNVLSGQMCFKIAFSSVIINIRKFLENRIGQSGVQISSHIFNLHYNSEQIVWNQVFTTFCLSANKFCTILAVTCDEKEMAEYLSVYKKKVSVKLGNAMAEILKRNKPQDYLLMYCVNHFRYLSFKALYHCAKLTRKCNGLVPLINAELSKCNCIFGKWKDHAARIDADGNATRKAVRGICKRGDLKLIMKNFDALPSDIDLYNQTKF